MTTNTSIIEGNLTADPELRYGEGSGVAFCRLRVAVNRNRKQGDEWVEETSFFDVTAFDRLAENVASSCSKGDRILVEARLEQRTWETPEGDKRSAVGLVANAIGASLRWATATIVRNEKKETVGVGAGGGEGFLAPDEEDF